MKNRVFDPDHKTQNKLTILIVKTLRMKILRKKTVINDLPSYCSLKISLINSFKIKKIWFKDKRLQQAIKFNVCDSKILSKDYKKFIKFQSVNNKINEHKQNNN